MTKASVVLAVALGACSNHSPEAAAEPAQVPTAGRLVLVQEKKLSRLLDAGLKNYEASGIALRDGSLYVVFDNSTRLGILDVALTTGRLMDGSDESSQYEGVTAAGGADSGLYVVVEADASGTAVVVPFDRNVLPRVTETTDIAFADRNKGIEGIAWISLGATEYLLALCEGNLCTQDETSIGNGRIKVLAHRNGMWVTDTTLSLPTQAAFVDYSDIAILPRDDASFDIAVLSQQSSVLWMGVLTMNPWVVVGSGAVYDLPRSNEGAIQYCNLEGVTFLDRTTLAMVSDRSDGKGACGNKDESAHIFRLP